MLWFRSSAANKCRPSRAPTSKMKTFSSYICLFMSSHSKNRWTPSFCKQPPLPPLQKQQLSEAKYLPYRTPKGLPKTLDRAGFTKWLNNFKNEQKNYCGAPVASIVMNRKDEMFANASINSWPWMVSLHNIIIGSIFIFYS